jgi:hypothetical protein
MFWDFLSLLAGVAACSGAILAGRNTGTLGTSISIAIGLVLGFAFFYLERTAGKKIFQRAGLYDAKLPPLKLILSWLLCLAAFAWIFVSWFAGSYITKSLSALWYHG